jgi:peptidyl-prolyl cis-trans isomerase C
VYARNPAFILTLATALLAAQSVTPETVVATVNGRKITAGDVDRILLGAPPALRENLRQNRKLFLENYALVSTLAATAEKERLPERSPYREQLAWMRGQVLMQAAISERYQQFRAGGSDAEAEVRLREWLNHINREATVTVENEQALARLETVSDGEVVAVVKGRRMTAGELLALLRGASPQIQQNLRANPKQFLVELARMNALVEYAEKEQLPEKSPYREQLDWVRSDLLSQAILNDFNLRNPATAEEEKQYYDSRRDDFTEARVKVIYISFAAEAKARSSEGRKYRSEQEARAAVELLRKQILDGADFIELVKKQSEDAASRAKDGDLGVIRRKDQIPEAIKEAIFSLKPGQVSQVVRQPNGFYLFRVEEIRTKTLDEVRDEVNREVQSAKFQGWFDGIRKSVAVTYENEGYFRQPEAGPASER